MSLLLFSAFVCEIPVACSPQPSLCCCHVIKGIPKLRGGGGWAEELELSTSAIEASASAGSSQTAPYNQQRTSSEIDKILKRLEREEELQQQKSEFAHAEEKNLSEEGNARENGKEVERGGEGGGEKNEGWHLSLLLNDKVKAGQGNAELPMKLVSSVKQLGDSDDPVDMIASRIAQSEKVEEGRDDTRTYSWDADSRKEADGELQGGAAGLDERELTC
eukprot:717796-Hanusia_phi.AAC.3